MATGDIDDKTVSSSELPRLRAESKELDDYLTLAWTFRPYHSFFIPFGAGISEDGMRVYISNDLETLIQGIECENALVRHETTEWALRRFLGIGEDYETDPEGHRIANTCEFERAAQLIDTPNAVELYTEVIDQQILAEERTSIEGKPIPRDLALYPYEGEPTLRNKLMEEMWNDRSDEEWYRINPHEYINQPTPEAKVKVDNRLTRDCFLYLDPKPPVDRFAQCSTCKMWMVNDLCAIHGPDVRVTGNMSCGLYVNGTPNADPKPGDSKAIVTPTESGLVDREVRCENCRWFSNVCDLFELLNHALPASFNLDEKVEAKGCCNANQPRTNGRASSNNKTSSGDE